MNGATSEVGFRTSGRSNPCLLLGNAGIDICATHSPSLRSGERPAGEVSL